MLEGDRKRRRRARLTFVTLVERAGGS